MSKKIYLGNWMTEEQKCLKAFFNWYFHGTLTKRITTALELTDEEWKTKYDSFRKTVWPNYSKDGLE